MNLPAACRIAGELFRGSGNDDEVDRIESADAKWRAGSSLAVKTMTGDNQFWWSWKRECQSAAAASGVSHWKTPSVFGSLRSLSLCIEKGCPCRDQGNPLFRILDRDGSDS